jgi:hypothetical protein
LDLRIRIGTNLLKKAALDEMDFLILMRFLRCSGRRFAERAASVSDQTSKTLFRHGTIPMIKK